MRIFDQYVLRSFLRVLLVSFLSLTGLYVVVDLFGNLDEFLSYAEQQGSLLGVLSDYYGPRVFAFFDRTSALLSLLAVIFTVTWLQRRNELTALMAAGIPKWRFVLPLILATMAISAVGILNRELALPCFRHKLTRNAQNWMGENAKRFDPRYDYETGILISGQATRGADQSIEQPNFRLPGNLSQFGRQLAAARALYRQPTPQHGGGYLLQEVTQPANLKEIASATQDGRPVILSPHDTPWLEPDQCFVTSNITFQHLTAPRAWAQYSSTAELISALRNPSLDYSANMRVTVHGRLVQPLLDVTLLLLGLPLVLTRSSRNMFVAAAQCLLLVAVFHVVILLCHVMGNNTYLFSPALAAWTPLLIFGPIAYTVAQRRWE
jgi:lipopolysaccharide export system permease protein